MRKKKTPSPRIANIPGGLGYVSCILQWLWAGIIYVPWLLSNDTFKQFILPNKTAQSAPEFHFALPSGVAIVIATISTVVVIAITLFVLVKVPSSVARGGKKVTQTSANALLPVITHHKKVSAKKRRILNNTLIKSTKAAIVLLPVLFSFGAYILPVPLQAEIIVVIAAALALGSILWFALQYGLAHVLHIPSEKLI